MQRFLIYLFLQMLYMFQAVPPPIIRSTKLYNISFRYCQSILLLATSVDEVVQFCAPDDGRRNRLKHVEHM